MNDDDVRMAEECRRAMPPDGDMPDFDAVFAGAERRYRRRRQLRMRYGAAAAIGALLVSTFLLVDRDQPLPRGDYIEIAELMNSTQWTAPSDVLLPRHEIDLYRELPVIPASTEPADGALL